MDVPLATEDALLDPMYDDVTSTPGAAMSTHGPQFENHPAVSVLVVAATVMASGVLEGEKLQAFALLLPAATATVTPDCTRVRTAEFMPEENEPPRLMTATAGLTRFAVTPMYSALI
eukprot:Colp12_sorted_trinity150504_noHs@27436